MREGINLSHVRVPGRVLGKPPQKVGPVAGREVDMKTLARDYLTAMDWDVDTGKPTKKKLLELGLKDVAESLSL